MDVLVLSRLQFAITTIYHFFFVPLTLGLSFLVALIETLYLGSGKELYLRMTKFWGKLFVINFALGVVTGIAQEFQFGMNWSEYSRFVGDIFGAPLAIEALLAFFLESTFLGLWIFGWDKLSKGLHATTMWMVALGSNISALWILIANSFMQEPVGYTLANARALLQDAPLLVLEEVTANLDALTEREVLRSIFDLAGARSLLVITHRLIGLERMDEILVLDQGRVVERGKQEAIAACRRPISPDVGYTELGFAGLGRAAR